MTLHERTLLSVENQIFWAGPETTFTLITPLPVVGNQFSKTGSGVYPYDVTSG